MPYEVVKVKGGFKVQKKGGELTSAGRKYFSDKPLTKSRAQAQMRALYANERTSPRRNVKSPTRRRKPTSPRRKIKKPTSPKPRKRTSSPKRYL